MIKVYGSPICKDCLAMKIIFEDKKVEYNYINITENTANFKEFLKIRDTAELFETVREHSGIGIPVFQKEEKLTFDINEALEWEDIAPIDQEELEHITGQCQLLLAK